MRNSISSQGMAGALNSLMQQYGVFGTGVEQLTQPLYDYQSYPTTGVSNLSFFQVPIGQSSKTLSDTNLQLAGQLPQGQVFFVTSFEIDFQPGAVIGTAGDAETAVTSNANDTQKVLQSGNFSFNIGTKNYLQIAPLMQLPPSFGIDVFSALSDATTAAATQKTVVDYARGKGDVFEVIPFAIPSNTNFTCAINWPALVTVTNQARIGAIMNGILVRNRQ